MFVRRRETLKTQLWSQQRRVSDLQNGLELLKESVLALRKVNIIHAFVILFGTFCVVLCFDVFVLDVFELLKESVLAPRKAMTCTILFLLHICAFLHGLRRVVCACVGMRFLSNSGVWLWALHNE